jgi:iron-sulfur cluster assembly accessory protein
MSATEINQIQQTQSFNSEFTIDDSATEQIKTLINNQEMFLRIMVDIGGCAGMKYHIILDDYISENDITFKKDNKIIVAIDDYSFSYIKGSVLEYEESFEGASFKINNPNATGSCSCGSSFSCGM